MPVRHCDQVDIRPSNHNDVINAQIYRSSTDSKLLWLPSMTFADLSKPETVLPGIEYLERRFGLGTFRSMGELNVVKQALFTGQRQGMTSGRPVTLDEIAQWSPFMAALRQRNMPIHLHSDLGNNSHPLQYWPLIQRVLELYPDNKIVWLHLGLCVELSEFTGGPQQHIAVLEQALSSHKHLRLDLSWDVLWNDHFQKPERQPFYIEFINTWSHRLIPGTDYVASSNKLDGAYEKAAKTTSLIYQKVSDNAFRNIALGQSYFELFNLPFTAPLVC